MVHLGEVPALDEVSGHVASGSAVNRRGDVVPGHPGSGVPVDEVCADRAEEGEASVTPPVCRDTSARTRAPGHARRTVEGLLQLDPVLVDEVAVVLPVPEARVALQLPHVRLEAAHRSAAWTKAGADGGEVRCRHARVEHLTHTHLCCPRCPRCQSAAWRASAGVCTG